MSNPFAGLSTMSAVDPAPSTRRAWRRMHLVPVFTLLVMGIEGYRLEHCPRPDANGKHGPFAYGDRPLLVDLALWALLPYFALAFVALVASLATPSRHFPTFLVTAANQLVVLLFMLAVGFTGYLLADGPMFCDGSGIANFAIFLGIPLVAALVVNTRLPAIGKSRGTPPTPSPNVDIATQTDPQSVSL